MPLVVPSLLEIQEFFTQSFQLFSLSALMTLGIIFFVGLFIAIISSLGIIATNRVVTRLYKDPVFDIQIFSLYKTAITGSSAGLLGGLTALLITNSSGIASLFFFIIAFGSYWPFFRSEVTTYRTGSFYQRLKQRFQIFFLKIFYTIIGCTISYIPLYKAAQTYLTLLS